jgi:hypothetical protein
MQPEKRKMGGYVVGRRMMERLHKNCSRVCQTQWEKLPVQAQKEG